MTRAQLLPVLLLLLASGCSDDRALAPSQSDPDVSRVATASDTQDPIGNTFHPERRLGGVAPDPPVLPDGPAVPGQAVITLGIDDDQTDFNATWGTTTLLVLESSRSTLVELPTGVNVRELASDMIVSGECEWAEPNYLSETPEGQQGTIPFYEGDHVFTDVADQDALDRIGATTAHLTSTGVGITVAILDTGIDSTHPDLAASVSSIGWDFIDNDASALDERNSIDDDGDGFVDEGAGHGTHVAGLVLAAAPDVTLLPVRVLDSEGMGTSVGVARGIRWAAQNGADIINLSLGMYVSSHVIKKAIREATTEGVIVVNSAGNLGLDDRDHFPARMGDVVSVAASDPVDSKATFSNYGPNVVVSAPGEGLLSTFLDGGYAVWSGTSMAAPLVSGSIALRLQVAPTTSLDTLEEAIEETSAPLLNEENSPWEGKMGDGRIAADLLVGF